MPEILLAVLIIALIIALLVFLGWWLLIESEGVYLGRRVVIWLYDVYATRYDGIKHLSKQHDHRLLAQPLMERVAPNKAPLVLDVATGTGRLPLAMIRHKHFVGRVIGVDLSRKMLAQAKPKFAKQTNIHFVLSPAEQLPFPDETFDIVTCLEAIEFTSNRRQVLYECVRVLKSGGVMLITNRINTRYMPGKIFTSDEIANLLLDFGMDEIEIQKWQVDYDRVWAIKPRD